MQPDYPDSQEDFHNTSFEEIVPLNGGGFLMWFLKGDLFCYYQRVDGDLRYPHHITFLHIESQKIFQQINYKEGTFLRSGLIWKGCQGW